MRWLPADQWHVTLRFLGEADPDEASAALAGLVAAPAEAVVGPSTRLLGDSVLVVPVAGLDRLAAEVMAATAGVGEPPEDRPFVGHLTLCRFRDGPPSGAAGAAIHTTFPVDEVVLVRSRTLPAGAVHDVLERFVLTG